MENLKKFITDKKTETWFWLTANSFLILSIDYLTGLDLPELGKAMAIGLLSIITKWINTKYIKKS
jgi:hypothetical protein